MNEDVSTVRVQRRTMGTLAGSQVCGGIGAFAAIAVATLLAKAIVGSDSLAGLPQTSRELGAAAAAYGIGRISTAHGRRVGLATGYLTCVLGSVLCVLAGVLSSFTALMVGMILVGAGLASTWQARFAATDLVHPRHTARALSVVVWATTVGAAAGPALAGPAGDAVAVLGVPPLTGGFLVGALGALAAAVWVVVRMRPDPRGWPASWTVPISTSRRAIRGACSGPCARTRRRRSASPRSPPLTPPCLL